MLYQAGDKLGGWLDTVGPSSFGFGRLVGIFYFIVLFMFMEGVAALVHLIASGSELDTYIDLHFDTLLYVILGAFMVYMLGRVFWDSFWDTEIDGEKTRD